MILWLALFILTITAVIGLLRPLLQTPSSLPQQSSVSTKKISYAQAASVIAILFGLPTGALLLYGKLGAPGLPSQPYAERALNDPDFARNLEAERVLRTLDERPDAAGYKDAGDIFMSLHRFGKAAEAFRRAAALSPRNAEIWSSLGESLALSNRSEVSPDARDAFLKAFKLDRHDARAEFYLGLAAAQSGDARHAIAIWRDLQKSSEADAAWQPLIEEHIKILSQKNHLDPHAIPPASPLYAPAP